MWSDFSQAFLLKTWKNINTPRFVQNSRHYLTTFNEKSLENSSSTKIKSMLITRIYAGDTWDVDMINCGKCVELFHTEHHFTLLNILQLYIL